MANSLLSSIRNRWIFISCWVCLALLQVSILWWMGFSWEISVADSFTTNALLMSAGALISNNLRFYQPEQERYLYVVVWCLLLAGIWIFFSYNLLVYILPDQPAYLDLLYKSLPVRFFLGFLLIGWMALISIISYSREDQKEIEQRKADAEKLSREAELSKLRQQLQPHFLFNSLNSIAALIGSKPEKAREMIHQLSDFLRGTLKKEENEWVTLTEELQHLQLYLDIEKVRFGHRLSTVITQDEASGGMRLPAMLLQPLVENAIKFGLYDTTGEVIISLEAAVGENYLVLVITNPYDPDTAQPWGTGFGLSGVKRRLYLLFARHDLLETRGDKNIFTTTVKIPQV